MQHCQAAQGVGGDQAHVVHPALLQKPAPGGVALQIRTREPHEVALIVVADADRHDEGLPAPRASSRRWR